VTVHSLNDYRATYPGRGVIKCQGCGKPTTDHPVASRCQKLAYIDRLLTGTPSSDSRIMEAR